jgi:hypothetical protein
MAAVTCVAVALPFMGSWRLQHALIFSGSEFGFFAAESHRFLLDEHVAHSGKLEWFAARVHRTSFGLLPGSV